MQNGTNKARQSKSSPRAGIRSPSSTGGVAISVGSSDFSNGVNGSSSAKTSFLRSESMAYPAAGPGQVFSMMQFHARQNTKAVLAVTAFVLALLIITSDGLHDLGTRGAHTTHRLRGSAVHWGGAVRPGYFRVNDSSITPPNVESSTRMFRFAAVTDLDQLSAIPETQGKKPKFRSYFLPGILKRTGVKDYEISFEQPRELVTGHNEAGRGAEFSELTIYNDRLLTFDDRTGDVFEILNNDDGTESSVVPRFVITEGDGDTDKGMKWEWATVKDGELYMGSMGKEYTASDGTVMNTNNLWIGVLNARGELRREDWKDKYQVVRKALGAESPGYIIMEAILWSDAMKKWVFLPRRISSTQYDENEDERKGGTKLVLVDEHFTKAEVVSINLEADPLRGFSSFAFVPGTGDRHAVAIRSVEENCTGAMDVCSQRSYFSVFDVKTGELLSQEKKYKEDLKFEGVEFANMYATPNVIPKK